MNKKDRKHWQIKQVTQTEPSFSALKGKGEGVTTEGKGFASEPFSLLGRLWFRLTRFTLNRGRQDAKAGPRQVKILKEMPVRYLRGHVQSVEIGLEKLQDGEQAVSRGQEAEARLLFAEALRMDRDTRVQQRLLILGEKYQRVDSLGMLAESLFEMLATLHLPGTVDRFAGPTDSLAADGERILVSPRVAAEARFRLGVMHYHKGSDHFPRAAALLEASRPHDEQLCAERDYLLGMIHLYRAPREDDKAAFIARARQLLDSAALQGYTPALSQLETMS